MNLGTMRGYVQSYMIDVPSTVTDALINAWINEGLRKAEVRHNFRYMAQTHEATTVIATRKLDDKPALWKEAGAFPWYLRDDGADRQILFAPSLSEMLGQYDATDTDDKGAPEFVLETESELHVYPFPDGLSDWTGGEYRVRVPYWSYTAELDADDDDETDHPFLGLAPWYAIWYAIYEGLTLVRDEARAVGYLQKAEAELMLAMRRDKASRLPDRMTLVPRRDVYGPAISARSRKRYRRGYLP